MRLLISVRHVCRSPTTPSSASTLSSRSSQISAKQISSRSAIRCSRSSMRESKRAPQLSETTAVVYWAEVRSSSEVMQASTTSCSCRSTVASSKRFSRRSHRWQSSAYLVLPSSWAFHRTTRRWWGSQALILAILVFRDLDHWIEKNLGKNMSANQRGSVKFLAVIVICLQIVWYHVSPSSALLIYSLLASSHRLHAQSGPWILVFFLQALLISILVFFLRALLLVLARWATLGWPRWGVTNYSWWRLAI